MKHEAFIKEKNWKIAGLVLVAIIVTYSFLSITFDFFPFNDLKSDEKNDLIGNWNDFFQIIFFLVTAIIAILSYRQARETLFNPIRTEIFKIQVKEYEGLVDFFRKDNITDEFDYPKIVHINSLRMLDDYANTFFSNEFDEEKLKESRKKITSDVAGGLIPIKYITNDEFESIDYETEISPKKPKKNDIKNPALILRKWESYTHSMVEYTFKYHEVINHINKISSSPLLPTELVGLIKAFQSKQTDNLVILSDFLTEKAKELPDKYPTINKLQKINPIGFWNEFNGKKNDLKVESDNILNFINKYLKVDDIIKNNAS